MKYSPLCTFFVLICTEICTFFVLCTFVLLAKMGCTCTFVLVQEITRCTYLLFPCLRQTKRKLWFLNPPKIYIISERETTSIFLAIHLLAIYCLFFISHWTAPLMCASACIVVSTDFLWKMTFVNLFLSEMIEKRRLKLYYKCNGGKNIVENRAHRKRSSI